jgi:plastocyanin
MPFPAHRATRSAARLASALCLLSLNGVQAAELSVAVDLRGRGMAEDTVVMVEALEARPAAPSKASALTEIIQQGRQFKPRVTVVPVGTPVSFPNLDNVRHHVYSFSEAKVFELKLYVGKPERPVVFDKPGVVVLGCNIHDQMAAWVVVSDTPWAQKTDRQGAARWSDIPAGDYRLRVWHPDLPPGHPGPTQSLRLGAAPVSVQIALDLP